MVQESKEDPNNEAEKIVKTPAKLIVSEIRNQILDCGYNPDYNYIVDVQKKHRLVDSESEAVHGIVCSLLRSTGKYRTMFNACNTPTVNVATIAVRIGSRDGSCISVTMAA